MYVVLCVCVCGWEGIWVVINLVLSGGGIYCNLIESCQATCSERRGHSSSVTEL